MLEKYLLIDNYLNETRVAIVKDSVLEDFDDEQPASKLKKGNIYIGRIMRIEPSLQAAFVDFGFEKHGFLAFSEIRSPDMLIQRPSKPLESNALPAQTDGTESLPTEHILELSETEDEERPHRPITSSGKIHDIIKRQQLIMVQVIKDERGSKGAALTTYISLPGRYGFLLPNTPKASGVSKKITDTSERDALKVISGSLELPDGMSFILRSASMGRKKSEIKRDYDFLMKTWLGIAAHPVDAVGLVYSEQDLLIRALRDLYANDVKEVIIQGEDAFKRAKSYIRAVFPSHSKKISLHSDTVGLFEKFKIESHIQSIYDHTVKLPSGGSIVLNQTEALVSIDVNSSKSTQERNIEDTALKTNLEATVAIARNLKLRDLAGLIVIDFIDLHPNKRPLVEKALKEALSTDRARLKIGKISEFGLLEMSRQRLRQSLMETNTHVCTTCRGSGRILSLSMQVMQALRAIERIASIVEADQPIVARGSSDIVLRFLNEHRQFLCDIEKKYKTTIQISCDTQSSGGFFEIISPIIAEKPVVPETKTVAPKKRRRNRGKPSSVVVSMDSGNQSAPSEEHTPAIVASSPSGAASAVLDTLPNNTSANGTSGGEARGLAGGKPGAPAIRHKHQQNRQHKTSYAGTKNLGTNQARENHAHESGQTTVGHAQTAGSMILLPDIATIYTHKTKSVHNASHTSSRTSGNRSGNRSSQKSQLQTILLPDLQTNLDANLDTNLPSNKKAAVQQSAKAIKGAVHKNLHAPAPTALSVNDVQNEQASMDAEGGSIKQSRRSRLRKKRQARKMTDALAQQSLIQESVGQAVMPSTEPEGTPNARAPAPSISASMPASMPAFVAPNSRIQAASSLQPLSLKDNNSVKKMGKNRAKKPEKETPPVVKNPDGIKKQEYNEIYGQKYGENLEKNHQEPKAAEAMIVKNTGNRVVKAVPEAKNAKDQKNIQRNASTAPAERSSSRKMPTKVPTRAIKDPALNSAHLRPQDMSTTVTIPLPKKMPKEQIQPTRPASNRSKSEGSSGSIILLPPTK